MKVSESLPGLVLGLDCYLTNSSFPQQPCSLIAEGTTSSSPAFEESSLGYTNFQSANNPPAQHIED